MCDKSFRNGEAIFRALKKDQAMKFASTRLIAADIKALVGFYKR